MINESGLFEQTLTSILLTKTHAFGSCYLTYDPYCKLHTRSKKAHIAPQVSQYTISVQYTHFVSILFLEAKILSKSAKLTFFLITLVLFLISNLYLDFSYLDEISRFFIQMKYLDKLSDWVFEKNNIFFFIQHFSPSARVTIYMRSGTFFPFAPEVCNIQLHFKHKITVLRQFQKQIVYLILSKFINKIR